MAEARTDFHATRKLLVPPATSLAASFLLAACLLLSPGRLSSQVVPAARGASDNIWAGAEYSSFLPDFGPSQRITGVGAFVDWNKTPRLGVEAEVRFLRFGGFSGESQDSYLAGPKITLLRRGRLVPYAKFLLGIGQNDFPFKIGTGKYLALAPGGGLDYRFSHRLALRGEYEYQLWPSAPGVKGYPSNGMKPNGFSVGFAYRLFGK
jgi:opacity protein-like surface antigen